VGVFNLQQKLDDIVVEIGRMKMSTQLDREKNNNHSFHGKSQKLSQKWLTGSKLTKYSHSFEGCKEFKELIGTFLEELHLLSRDQI
jgi:hypothetical protein